jgi:hypothetical protein
MPPVDAELNVPESAWKANQALRRPLIGELFEKDLAELADDAEPDVS